MYVCATCKKSIRFLTFIILTCVWLFHGVCFCYERIPHSINFYFCAKQQGILPFYIFHGKLKFSLSRKNNFIFSSWKNIASNDKKRIKMIFLYNESSHYPKNSLSFLRFCEKVSSIFFFFFFVSSYQECITNFFAIVKFICKDLYECGLIRF